ncbi:helix-turn-helix transcriptional regulator [Dysgonomonas sp. ZJ279]|uniref:helix-turn-helix transcriptional regulator n=1 Tax=Dysgonomonas sp. ZJ279 TaxID=2709796 RepID=UPI0013EE3784|nr:helix-turn-helix transcriptional regulator [Dysgonomonas sp. ZJ279]
MYIAAGLFNIFLKQFEDIQIDISKIFSEFATDLKILDNPIAKIDANIFGRYMEQIVAKKNNQRIGLEIGFIIPFTLTGTIFNLYHNRATVGDIFEDLDLLDPTENDIIHYTTKTEGDLFYYEISISQEFVDKYPVASRQWYEMQYGISLQYSYSFTGRYLYPVSAHSVYKKEGKMDKLEKYLNCPVEFGQNKLALIFNKSVLDLPVITASRDFLPIFENFIAEIQDSKLNNVLSGAVRRYLLHSISTINLDLKLLAERFNMSERNIQRKLKLEGTSYQLILNDLRIELSRKYLKEKISLTEITFLLGFESQSAFNKFFKKHFGCTPSQYMSKLSS